MDERDRFTDHWLYRCWDRDGRLLYVGITTTGVKRFRVHGNRADWWPQVANITIEHHESEKAVRAAEIAAIQREHPLHNRDFRVERTNVVQLWRRCRLCREHWRPEPLHKPKTICPACAEQRRISAESQQRARRTNDRPEARSS